MTSWVDLTWPMLAAACLTLGTIHGFVWIRHRGGRAHLPLAVAALAVAVITLIDLFALRATSPAQLGTLIRWMHVPVAVLLVAFIGLVHSFLDTRFLALGLAAAAIRAVGLVLDFTSGENLNFIAVTGVGRLEWWGGEQVSYPTGIPNPWAFLNEASNAVLIAYVLLSFAAARRRSDPARRRGAAIVTAAWLAVIATMVTSAMLYWANAGRPPFFAAPAFAVVIVATSWQLAAELARSASLAASLRASELRALASERDLAQAAQAAELELWRVDLTGHAAGPHPGATSGAAATVEALLARVHVDDRTAVANAIDEAIVDGAFASEFRELTAEGKARWTSASGRVEFDEQRRPRTIRAIARDVSERHAAAERFRSLFECAPVAILLVARDGTIVLANEVAAQVFATTRAAIEGSAVESLLPERFRNAHVALRNAFAADPVPHLANRREVAGLRADGREVPVEISLKPVELADGPYLLTTITDITARKRAEQEATLQRDELAHLSRVAMIGELSGSLAHELNQPLTAILSNAQAAQRLLLNNSGDRQDLQDILADIVDDDRRAGEVIRRMRILLKKGHVEHAPADVNALVIDVLRLIRSDLIQRGVQARVELAPGPLVVDADPVQLQQVLVNLIFNASDAMEAVAGPRTVIVRSARPAPGAARIEVEDCGTGIPPDMLERIFEPFESTKPQGMGLGLAVCRTILQAHDGRIWAENVATGGARVCFETHRSGDEP